MSSLKQPSLATILSTALLILPLIATDQASAATLTVDSTVDTEPPVSGDGACTLREAIADINAGAASADCPNTGAAFGTSDTIDFAPALAGSTLTLDGVSLPFVGTALSIEGPVPTDPSGITISGGDASRIFVLQGSGTFLVEFSDLTLTQGSTAPIQSGGAIAAFSAEVALTNVDLIDNSADLEGGGLSVLNGNSATITDSRVTGNIAGGTSAGGGGGVFVTGDLLIINSEISNNSTDGDNAAGGGAFAGGALTLVNSSITGNSTTGDSAHGGGLAVRTGSLTINSATIADNTIVGAGSDGGGLHLDEADARISALTASGNSAANGNGGGILADNSDVEMVNSTISGNSALGDGGGILASGDGSQVVRLVHTTVAFNMADGPNADGVDLSSGTLNLVNSLIVQGDSGEAACRSNADSFVNSLATDATCTGTATAAASINLLPLADYGGGRATHALGNASVAIDAAPNDGLCQDPPPAGAGGADQRGVSRPQPAGGLCDPGAYEADGSEPLPVSLNIAGTPPIELAEAGGAAPVETCVPTGTTASEDITVTLGVTGTATPGVDHDLNDATTLVIASGTTCESILLTAIDDAAIEGDETVVIDIDSVTTASDSAFEASPPQQVNAVIIDDDDEARAIPTLGWTGSLMMIVLMVIGMTMVPAARRT
jgi:CSLREA domain-containing protein